MARRDLNYPYPVLMDGLEDYNDSSFGIECLSAQANPNELEVELMIKYYLDCPGLKKMIDRSEAKIALQVFSKLSSYRKIFYFDSQNEMFLKIPFDKISNKIEIAAYIISQEESLFSLDEHNQDLFFNVRSEIRKFDKLAIASSITVDVDPVEMTNENSSIFLIQQNSDQKYSIDIDLSGEKILILMNEKLYHYYITMRENHGLNIFLSSQVIIPVVVEALKEIELNQYESNDKRWFKKIVQWLEKRNIDLNKNKRSCISIANEILGDGLMQSFLALNDFCDDSND
jgi:hypothetical protein